MTPTSTPLDNPAVPLNSPGIWAWLSGGRESDSGEIINENTALQVSTIYSCVRILSDSIAALPLHLYRETLQGRVRAVDEPLHYLLAQEPNTEQTAFSYIGNTVASMALHGNAYSEIQRGVDGTPVALWPLHPLLTVPKRTPNGDLVYQTTDGEQQGKSRILAAKDVLHVPLFSVGSDLIGFSPIERARQGIGLARAAERFGSQFIRNYATPSVVISTDAAVKPEDKTRMRLNWENLQSGSNRHRIAILDNGMKIQPLSISPEEMQFLQLRQFSRQELAALYGIPASMVGDTEKVSMASAEQQALSFVQDTLAPYIRRIEQEFERKLLGKNSGRILQFDLSQRIRGDYASVTAGIATLRNWGIITVNDARRQLGLNEVGAEGDVLITPINMQNSTVLLKPLASPAQKELSA